MPSSYAEIARTLAAGRLPGLLAVTATPEDIAVRHAATADGSVLIASRRDSAAWLALVLTVDDTAAVLTIDDEPPFPESPSLGRVHVCGWLHRVAAAELAAAALEFADANPIDDLLDVGSDVDLFRLEVGEVRLQRGNLGVRLEPEEFAGASVDPFHADERELLDDLRRHHTADLAALVPGAPATVTPLRLDRHGLLLALPAEQRWMRLEFGHVAHGPCCVSRALHLNHAAHLRAHGAS